VRTSIFEDSKEGRLSHFFRVELAKISKKLSKKVRTSIFRYNFQKKRKKMMKKLLALVMLLGSLLYAVSTENILALSWQHGFCKVHPRNSACLNRKRGDYSLTTIVTLMVRPKDKSSKSNPKDKPNLLRKKED
jgi:hypothetical protein